MGEPFQVAQPEFPRSMGSSWWLWWVWLLKGKVQRVVMEAGVSLSARLRPIMSLPETSRTVPW